MANMIIKPAVGGNLLIQDRAGGAVLSTGTSGATMASNVTGIPAAGVTGVLPAAVTGGSGLTELGTVTSGNLSNTDIVYPAGHILKINSFHNSTRVVISGNATGAAIIDQDFTALRTNSAYYLSMTLGSFSSSRHGNSDNGDRGITAWLEDSGASDKYRFGYRNTTNPRHTVLMAANDYYAIWDSDGGFAPSTSTWGEDLHAFAWVSGNQASWNSTAVASSAFTAGETVTLRVWMASHNGCIFNASHATSTQAAYSHFSIIEVAT